MLRAYPSRSAPVVVSSGPNGGGAGAGSVCGHDDGVESIQCGDTVLVDRWLVVPKPSCAPSPEDGSVGSDGHTVMVYSRVVSVSPPCTGATCGSEPLTPQATSTSVRVRGWVFSAETTHPASGEAKEDGGDSGAIALVPPLLERLGPATQEQLMFYRTGCGGNGACSGWQLQCAALSMTSTMQSLMPAGSSGPGGGTGVAGLGR